MGNLPDQTKRSVYRSDWRIIVLHRVLNRVPKCERGWLAPTADSRDATRFSDSQGDVDGHDLR